MLKKAESCGLKIYTTRKVKINPDVNSAVYFWFVQSGATLSAANVSAGGGVSFLPFDRFSTFFELLRNEEPMFCSYTRGVPDPFARIATSAETPREGE